MCIFATNSTNVRIKLFKLLKCTIERERERNTIWKTDEYEKISTIINHETSNHVTSTCFMLFCNDLGYMTAKN